MRNSDEEVKITKTCIVCGSDSHFPEEPKTDWRCKKCLAKNYAKKKNKLTETAQENWKEALSAIMLIMGIDINN